MPAEPRLCSSMWHHSQIKTFDAGFRRLLSWILFWLLALSESLNQKSILCGWSSCSHNWRCFAQSQLIFFQALQLQATMPAARPWEQECLPSAVTEHTQWLPSVRVYVQEWGLLFGQRCLHLWSAKASRNTTSVVCVISIFHMSLFPSPSLDIFGDSSDNRQVRVVLSTRQALNAKSIVSRVHPWSSWTSSFLAFCSAAECPCNPFVAASAVRDAPAVLFGRSPMIVHHFFAPVLSHSALPPCTLSWFQSCCDSLQHFFARWTPRSANHNYCDGPMLASSTNSSAPKAPVGAYLIKAVKLLAIGSY